MSYCTICEGNTDTMEKTGRYSEKMLKSCKPKWKVNLLGDKFLFYFVMYARNYEFLR